MNPLLIGRWQATKFISHGVATHYKEHAPLYKIHPDGKVEYAYWFEGEWVHKDNLVIKEMGGKTMIATQWVINEEVISVTENELQLGVEKRYGGFAIIYFYKRLKDKD